MKKLSGTYEWSTSTSNCVRGCQHGCRYCFSRQLAIRFPEKMPKGGWESEEVDEAAVAKEWKKKSGIIMFPSVHDISPTNLQPCLIVLQKMLSVGNRVLIVSKPHLECISRICADMDKFKRQVMFRFTIGADDDEILSYWEPHAPPFQERLDALRLACEKGWRTSVSMEPCLDPLNVVRVFNKLEPWANSAIWIGKMNKTRERVRVATPRDEEMLRRIEEHQTDDDVKRIFAALMDRRVVRWKESFREILGIEAGREEWHE